MTDHCAIHHAEGEGVLVVAHYPPPEMHYPKYQYHNPYNHRYLLPTPSRNDEHHVTWTAPGQGNTA